MRRLGFWLVVAIVGAWACVWVVAASKGAIAFEEGVALEFTGLGLAVVWSIVSICSAAVWEHRRRWVWIAAPVAGVAAIGLAATDLPLTARLWMSEAAVRDYAENAQPDPTGFLVSPQPRRVGLFEVTRVRGQGNAVLLQTCHTGSEQVGIAYSPTPPARAEMENNVRFVHLYGPWYRYQRHTKSDFD